MMYESCIFFTITKSEEVLYGFSMKHDLYFKRNFIFFIFCKNWKFFARLFSTNITQQNIEDVIITMINVLVYVVEIRMNSSIEKFVSSKSNSVHTFYLDQLNAKHTLHDHIQCSKVNPYLKYQILFNANLKHK